VGGGQGRAAQAHRLPPHAPEAYYLQKDGEPYFHLVNEPFDYDKIKA